MKLPKRLTLKEANGRKRRYAVVRRSNMTDHHGPIQADVHFPSKRIRLSWRLDEYEKLTILIHESTHVAVPDLEEEAVLRIEENVMAVLAAIGEELDHASKRAAQSRRVL